MTKTTCLQFLILRTIVQFLLVLMIHDRNNVICQSSNNLSSLSTTFNSTSSSLNQTSFCPSLSEGRCVCFDHTEEILPFHRPSSPVQGLRVECSNMTGLFLHHDIDRINKKSPILALSVRDSRMDDLNGLPSGLVDLKHLTLDQTGIDLEQVRESSEILKDLKSFKVLRERFTEIPENFFQDLHHVVNLALNDVGIKAISEDGFKFLEDSLKDLSLKQNKLRSIPIAVEFLYLLESLDLSDNEITTVGDDVTRRLESGLKSLSRLTINTMNCTCSLASSEFVEWIRSHAIRGVTCRFPQRLFGRDISSAHTEDFCMTSSSSSVLKHSSLPPSYLAFVLFVITLFRLM